MSERQKLFLRFGYRPPQIKVIWVLQIEYLFWIIDASIQFRLLPCHQKMKCLHKNGNSYIYIFYVELKLFTGHSYREGNAQINYPFLFSQLGLRMLMECICTNSILSHSGSDISEQAFVKEYSIFYALG